ncbi:hypothetical protein A4X13_0g8834 [Tilletia indica]|uniref:FHA domain-containing protein n=1 Tax=Tilletia indica TaxID=43049 RepID=A0A177T016_9BASI|nr:hypothetical protein A4X13_0g8834 [Tilletia indica]
MSTSLHFLTLSPIDSPLPAQTVVFSPSDHLQLLVGGVRVEYYHLRPPHHTADFIFNEQFLRPDHCRLELLHHTPILTNCRDSGTTRVNGSALEQNERVVLHHSDKVELGHLDEYSGDFDNTLAFVVRLSSSPPIFHHRTIPADALLSTTSSVFAALQSAEDTRRRLHEELTSTQQQLQAALRATAEHTCTPPSPPRPYGQLLSDLRVCSLDRPESASTSLASSLSSLADAISAPDASSSSSLDYMTGDHPTSMTSETSTCTSVPSTYTSSPAIALTSSDSTSRSCTNSAGLLGSASEDMPSSSVSSSAAHVPSVSRPSSTLVLTSVLPSTSSSFPASHPDSALGACSPIPSSTHITSSLSSPPPSSSGSAHVRPTSPSDTSCTSRTPMASKRRSIDDVLTHVRAAWMHARVAVMASSSGEPAALATSRVFAAYAVARSALQHSSTARGNHHSLPAFPSATFTSAGRRSRVGLLCRSIPLRRRVSTMQYGDRPLLVHELGRRHQSLVLR